MVELEEKAALSPAEPSAEGTLARRLLAARRGREKVLGSGLFGEAAWDILLELFAAHEEGSAVSVTNVCIAANVPASTALRWISALEERGKLVRQQDPEDRRRTNISMSQEGAREMRSLLRNWLDSGIG